MNKLFSKGFLLLLPFIIIFLTFIIWDPMMIIHSYDSPFSFGNPVINDRSVQARWLIGDRKYNAFIFGSSRSKSFQTNFLKIHIKSDKIFHMGVNDETIYGIEKKIRFLDSLGYIIDYVLFSLDARILARYINPEPHTFREYYVVSGESVGEYYKHFFMAFIKPDFLKTYIKYKLFHIESELAKQYIWTVDFRYNKKTGDHMYYEYESKIADDSLGYYKKSKVFYNRDYADGYKPLSIINKTSEKCLKNIFEILKKQNTQYKIVITPNYDMKKIHETDLQILNNIFGQKSIFDFSGINDITKNIGNYYEEKHFKPYIANQILEKVYSK